MGFSSKKNLVSMELVKNKLSLCCADFTFKCAVDQFIHLILSYLDYRAEKQNSQIFFQNSIKSKALNI